MLIAFTLKANADHLLSRFSQIELHFSAKSTHRKGLMLPPRTFPLVLLLSLNATLLNVVYRVLFSSLYVRRISESAVVGSLENCFFFLENLGELLVEPALLIQFWVCKGIGLRYWVKPRMRR